jgi:hypothetical protein
MRPISISRTVGWIRIARITGLPSILVVATLAGGASVAQAAVTASQITSPASPSFALDDATLSSAPTRFTVQGTFDGGSSERLAVNCYYADGSHQTVIEGVQGVGGVFSAAVSSSTLLGGPPCVLRAVGSEDLAAYPPGSETSFQGPILAASELYESSLSQTRFDYSLTSVTPTDSYEFASAGACGLGHSHIYGDFR